MAKRQCGGYNSLAQLAAEVAGYAKHLRQIMLSTPMSSEMEALAQLIGCRHGHEEGAGLCAQLISYSLFAARCQLSSFSLPIALNLLCRALPRLEALLRPLRDADAPYLPVVQELAALLAGSDVAAVLGTLNAHTDPIIQGYEHFLAAYDPAQRGKHGIFYTPRPVASYMLRSLEVLLRREYGLPAGLASEGITLYDPCLGCGAFFNELMDVLLSRGLPFDENWGERLRGSELLPVPYLLAQLRLGLRCLETGERLPAGSNWGFQRANALSGHGFPGLAEGTMPVIFGNPPYAGHSAQHGGWVDHLQRAADGYFTLDGQPLREQNSKWLHDDYVKFFRLAQWHVARAGAGVVAFITNHGFLANPTFRGMRCSLLNTFDALYLLDLHGNTRKRAHGAEGGRDEGIFPIQPGVAISILVKRPGMPPAAPVVHYAELWGARAEKLDWLAAHDLDDTPWTKHAPSAPFYLFVPRGEDVAEEYQRGWPITAAMPVHSLGVLSKRDALVVGFSEEELQQKITRFADREVTDDACAAEFALPLRDRDGWDLAQAREAIRDYNTTLGRQLSKNGDWLGCPPRSGNVDIRACPHFSITALRATRYKQGVLFPEACTAPPAEKNEQNPIQPILYRPFDCRYLYDHDVLVARRNLRVLRHLRQPNVALLLGRQGEATGGTEWDLLFAADLPTDQNIFRRGGGTVFPLYLYDGASAQRVNFTPEFLDAAAQRLGMAFITEEEGDDERGFTALDLLHYIYALLHAPGYRQRYADCLALDFPRVPLTGNAALFRALTAAGARLLRLHLTGESKNGDHFSAISFHGDTDVRIIRYTPPDAQHAGRVWINPACYFDGIPPEAWAFHLGGYPVLGKWMKDRRGRRLSAEEMMHFRHMAATILATLALMQEIDTLIEVYGGWPIS